jgi:hypothetical protein
MLKKASVIIGWIVIVLLIAAAFALPGAYLLMIILGALSHMLNLPGLAIGFWASYLITILFSMFVTGSSRS